MRPYLKKGVDKKISSIRFWRDQNLKLIKIQEKAENRFYLIKYEDITNNPELSLPHLFNFIGEQWEKEILNYSEFDHDYGFEDPKIMSFNSIIKNSGNYKVWSKSLQKECFNEAEELFNHFGYSL